MPDTRHPLLGAKDSRQFKIYQNEWPAVFRFNGRLYSEYYNIDQDETVWREIPPELAERFLLGEASRAVNDINKKDQHGEMG